VIDIHGVDNDPNKGFKVVMNLPLVPRVEGTSVCSFLVVHVLKLVTEELNSHKITVP